ncbi:MAG: hypothetical protein KC613_20615, partial [Myxococcales bacterium]|nr:hypothetical protein [Myxococcales bacterium]
RAQLYEAWLKAYPQSRFQPVMARELDALRALAVEPAPVVAAAPEAPEPPVALHDRPRTVRAGQAVDLAVGFAAHERIDRVRVYAFRKRGDQWQEFNLTRDGDAYWRVALPPALLAEPGQVHYLIEAIAEEISYPVVGTPTKPASFQVIEPPTLEQPQGHSQMATSVRYVDFNTVGDATDAYFQFEGSFAYEVNFEALKTVRVGVGLLDGEGGPTDEIDGDPGQTRTFSVNYAFAEGELALGDWVGLAARGYAGNHHQTSDGSSAAVAGIEGRIRVGRADGTRITAGAAAMDVLGAQGFLHLDIEAVRRLPIRAGVVVTNLPVDADLGVQLEGQVGWRVNDLLTLHVLTGWNARTINHYGFTGGGGLTLDW